MATMPVEPGIVGMLRDALAEHGNRIVEAPEVSQPAPDPDHRLGIVRPRGEIFLGLLEVGAEFLLVRKLGGPIEGLAGQRHGFGFRGALFGMRHGDREAQCA